MGAKLSGRCQACLNAEHSCVGRVAYSGDGILRGAGQSQQRRHGVSPEPPFAVWSGRGTVMAKKPTTTPMDNQPIHGDSARPMAVAPTANVKGRRVMRSVGSNMQAETVRRRSLKKQRGQLVAARER